MLWFGWRCGTTVGAGLVALWSWHGLPVLLALPLEAVLACALTALLLLNPLLDYRLVDRPMARLVAFIGCDGAGKSTVAAQMRADLRSAGPVELCYLGLGSGAIGERIKRWPLIGTALERKLARKAKQSRTRGQRIPGLGTALVIYLFSMLRLRRFKRMLRLRRAGCMVLTDRYPQMEVAGFYDGPGLSAATAGNRLVAWLVERERQIYCWMAAFRPDMVVRLNVDAATALARKPEHRADLIARKVAVTSQLRFAGARIVDLDATQPYPLVCAAAEGAVRDTIRQARAQAEPIW